MSETLHIIKIGGKVVDDDQLLESLLEAFVAEPGLKILVHGGGKRATELSERLGIPARMVNGRRITDEATLEIAVMVYAGWFNKKVVGLLQARNCNALGLSGADGNLILAHKRPVRDIDYGWVGDIDQVNATGIASLLSAGFTPVFCAITHDRQGHLLNTNADTITARIAMALAPHYRVRLSFCFEKNGVLQDAQDDQTLLNSLSRSEHLNYQQSGAIHTGMLPKLDNAFEALDAGVAEVRVCGPATFAGNGGTQLHL